jgi:translation initiation factor IF-1
MKNWMILVFSLFLSFSTLAQTAAQPQNEWRKSRRYPELVVPATNDSALVKAVNGRRNVDFLEAKDMTVVRLLADDTNGLPHQKFMVRLSSGANVLCVYNLDMGQRIPLREGDVVGVGGQFKWTNQGGLMHWLHHDPKNHRPDGYVELAGKRYGLN